MCGYDYLKEIGMIKKHFSNFLRYAVIIFLAITTLGSIGRIYFPFNLSTFIHQSIILIILLILFVYFYKKHMNGWFKSLDKFLSGNNLWIILLIAFTLRLLWIIVVPTIPSSDFNLMYEYAGVASQGEFYGFKGTSYFARFAHDIITVLYFSLFYKFTSNPLWWVKFFNVIFSTLSVYFIYLLLKELFNKNRAVLGALLLALYPPYIMFTSETMSENMAIPFYILSIYLFIKTLKSEKKHWLLLVSGICLSLGNMFRMVGLIVIIAYGVYLFIYKGFNKGIKSTSLLIIGFILPMYITSTLLISSGITEAHIWQSKESNITSILKGTNFKYYGRWNPEDAQLPIDYNHDSEKIEAASKAIIKERFQKASAGEIGTFYLTKLILQWSIGDFDAVTWTVESSVPTSFTNFLMKNKRFLELICSIYFIMLLILSLKKVLLNKVPEEINFFYILLGGFVLLYLITEVQSRYSFIIGWIFIIFVVADSRRLIK